MALTEDDRELVEQLRRAREIVVAAFGAPVPDVIAATLHVLEQRQALADELAADEDAIQSARADAAWARWATAPVRSVAVH